ncbi:IS607 family transposase [Staphylothermus hellenicus]|uniref:DNA binding domain protein, excisionase family n=1 Tax=Staphylothermus hellenicus (strain DSM 12710 / JCM 10830 / BK20S6-10-b1 / P8) TaxID=591019 RepID=D7D962_STAHD|nr:IS607 family transposase [Staphylothermus hellenicus]ADI32308.1 DNA binding domain protein, excisionase family [Staphylothermus hellenicus DSM 12710]
MVYRTGKVARLLGVSKVTVIRWIRNGRIKAVRLGKEYRIPEDEVRRLLKGKTTNTAIIYARVSSSDQKEYLEKQIEYLKKYCSARGYNVVDVLTDIASGLNEERRGLRKLIDYVVNGKIDVVVVSYRDRLTRFGFKYLEEFFKSHGVRIEAVFGEEPRNIQQELVEDLIAIVTSFAGKLYGVRSRKKRRVVESVKQAIRDC